MTTRPQFRLEKTFALIGGISALIAAIIFRRWLSSEFDLLRTIGALSFDFNIESSSVIDWFHLLRENTVIGMLLLNVFDMLNYVLVTLMYFGVGVRLYKYGKSSLFVLAGFSIIGISLHFSGHQAFNILSLSREYFAAASESGQNIYTAAGQYALSVNNPVIFGNSLFWSYMCLYSGGLIMSIYMLRSAYFRRFTAILGIVACGLGLGYFFTGAFSPALGVIPAVSSAPLNMIWYILIGISLIKYARNLRSK